MQGRKENYRPNITHQYGCKNFKQIVSKLNLPLCKKMYHDQVGFIRGRQSLLNSRKSINIIHHFNTLKDKNHLIILIHAGQLSDKIKHPFMMNILNKRELPKPIKFSFLSLKKEIWDSVKYWKHSLWDQENSKDVCY